jgi:glycine cleavage system H protein
MSIPPAELLYAPTHEWIHIDGQEATIGLTDFAINLLSELSFLELPKLGATIQQGETFAEIESDKAVSDLYAPLSGEVMAINTPLSQNLGQLVQDPFTNWLAKIRLTTPAPNTSHLLTYTAYQQHCRSN